MKARCAGAIKDMQVVEAQLEGTPRPEHMYKDESDLHSLCINTLINTLYCTNTLMYYNVLVQILYANIDDNNKCTILIICADALR